MQTQIKQWGNSQGIRLNKELLEIAGMVLNEDIEIKADAGKITITKKYKHRKLEERAAEYGGRLNLDGEFDWGDSIGREIW